MNTIEIFQWGGRIGPRSTDPAEVHFRAGEELGLSGSQAFTPEAGAVDKSRSSYNPTWPPSAFSPLSSPINRAH